MLFRENIKNTNNIMNTSEQKMNTCSEQKILRVMLRDLDGRQGLKVIRCDDHYFPCVEYGIDFFGKPVKKNWST